MDAVDIMVPETHVKEEKRNWVSTKVGKLVAGSVLLLETNPITNDGARYALLGLSYGLTHSPEIAAAAYGASTLAYEGVGGIVTADALDTDTGRNLVYKGNKVLEKIGASNIRMNRPVEAAVALYGGIPAVTVLKHRENTERTRHQNRLYATAVSLGISAVCAAEGFAITEGIHAPNTWTIGLAALGAGGFLASWRWARRRISRAEADKFINERKRMTETAYTQNAENLENGNLETTDIRYDLSEAELKKLEAELVGLVEEKYPQEGVVAVWMRPEVKYANIVRTNEASYFPEVGEVSIEDERKTMLLALVDTRHGSKRVVHGATVSGVSYEDGEDKLIDRPELNGDKVGFIVVDQLIDEGNFTPQEFYDYYGAKGLDLSRSIAVETNLRIGDKVERYNGLTMAQLAYLEMFRRLEARRPELGRGAVFTTINRASILSFRRVGLQYEPLMGRTDFHTPEQELGKDFLPVTIPYNEQNIAVFHSMGEGVPELVL